jgi:tetratricopeptide (TPR) repeat protein
MNGPNLMEYVSSRYHLGFEEAHKEALTKLFTISPSALQAALFSPTDLYDTGYAHMKEIKLDARSQKEIMRQFLASFFSTLLEATVKDLRDPALRKALEANSIEGYNIVTKIIMANPANTVLNLHSETTTMLLPVKSEVKAGQLLSATSPDLFIRTGDTLLNLELFDQAIRDYDRAIAGLTDKKVLAIAWNNKGVCMMRLKRKDEAVKCFHEALSNDPSLEKARANLDSCTRS